MQAKKYDPNGKPVGRDVVELIDGDRLVDLCREAEIGVVVRPVVAHDWFKRFE